MGSQRVGHDWATELNWTSLQCSASGHFHLLPPPLCLCLLPLTLTNSPTKYGCDIPPPCSITQGLLWSHPQIQKTSLDPLGPSQHSSPGSESGASLPDPPPHTDHSSWAQPERQLLHCPSLKGSIRIFNSGFCSVYKSTGKHNEPRRKGAFYQGATQPREDPGRPRSLEI